jgi:hypothetical protein
MKILYVNFDWTTVVGCFVHGLYLEGAGWDVKKGCLIRQKPKQLIQDLPVLKIIPIESHRLKLQVGYSIKRLNK